MNRSVMAISAEPVPRIPTVCQVSWMVAAERGKNTSMSDGCPVWGSVFAWPDSISIAGIASHLAF